jgi:hypothetical protein
MKRKGKEKMGIKERKGGRARKRNKVKMTDERKGGQNE